MISYAQSARCRWRMLLDYFAASPEHTSHDELDGDVCGVCDNCLHPPQVMESPREAREHALDPGKSKDKDKDTIKPRPSFAPGDNVRVRRYGEGTVELVSGERIAVRPQNIVACESARNTATFKRRSNKVCPVS